MKRPFSVAFSIVIGAGSFPLLAEQMVPMVVEAGSPNAAEDCDSYVDASDLKAYQETVIEACKRGSVKTDLEGDGETRGSEESGGRKIHTDLDGDDTVEVGGDLCAQVKRKLAKAVQDLADTKKGDKKCLGKAAFNNLKASCLALALADVEALDDNLEGILESLNMMRTVSRGAQSRRTAREQSAHNIRKGAGASQRSSNKAFEKQSTNLNANEKGGHILGGAPVAPTSEESESRSEKGNKGMKRSNKPRELRPTTPPPPPDGMTVASDRFEVDDPGDIDALQSRLDKLGCPPFVVNGLKSWASKPENRGKSFPVNAGPSCRFVVNYK